VVVLNTVLSAAALARDVRSKIALSLPSIVNLLDYLKVQMVDSILNIQLLISIGCDGVRYALDMTL
jgi:hypothetical protein